MAAALLVLGALASGCARIGQESVPAADGGADGEAGASVALVDPRAPLAETWQHLVMGRATRYETVDIDGRAAIRAVGRQSASGLFRRVRFDPAACPWLEWSWRVDRLQRDADIRVAEGEDVAASIALVFGDPGFAMSPDPVPTLRYVWTSERVQEGAIVDNPYFPGVVRSIVVERGAAHRGTWMRMRRNLVDDFRLAFGVKAPATVEVIVLLTNNNHTREGVEAYYGAARVLCAAAPGLVASRSEEGAE